MGDFVSDFVSVSAVEEGVDFCFEEGIVEVFGHSGFFGSDFFRSVFFGVVREVVGEVVGKIGT